MKQDEFVQQLQALAVVKPLNKDNPHEGFEVKKIKHLPKPCSDCDKMVINRRIWNRLFFTPIEPHWRKTCSGCNKTQHPETKTYSLSNNGVTSVFREFLNKRDK
jgi:hypothetical protein